MIKFQNLWVIPLGFRKDKTGNFVVPSTELYLFVDQFFLCKGQEKPYFIILWNLDAGTLGYQYWQELCCVWLEMV